MTRTTTVRIGRTTISVTAGPKETVRLWAALLPYVLSSARRRARMLRELERIAPAYGVSVQKTEERTEDQ